MPQYYTLEEAAKVLRIPADELREKAKKKEVRAFQDRGNWRFLAQQIDELARQSGLGSDPDLQLSDIKPAAKDEDRLAVDFDLEDDSVPIGKEKPSDKGPRSSTKSGPRSPKPNPDSDVRLVLDNDMDFQIELDSEAKGGPSSSRGGPRGSSGSRPKPSGGRKSKFVDDSGPRLVDKPSDSDVKVVPAGDSGVGKSPKSQSDSDIRLDAGDSGKRRRSDAGIITEEIDLDAEEAREAARSKSQPTRKPQTKAANSPLLPTSSPFELSEHDLGLDSPSASKSGSKPGKKGKDQVDSSSDFELIPFDASKTPADSSSSEISALSDDSVGLGDLPAPNAGNSGINLQEPADSGISLESGGSDEIEFELTLDSGATPKPSTPKPAKKAAPVAEDDSSSEFELTLDESPSDPSDSEFELSLDESDDGVSLKTNDDSSDSEFELTLDDDGSLAGDEEESNDIFEDTNFDVPALDEEESGSQAVALDEADTDAGESDFEISLDEDSEAGSDSESQVVALDDEEDAEPGAATVAQPRKAKPKSKLKAPASEELDLDLDASAEHEADEAALEEESDDEVVTAGASAPAEWGALPVVLLAPTVLVMFVVSLMGFELIQGMWGYHRPAKVGRPIIDTIARQFDETLPKD